MAVTTDIRKGMVIMYNNEPTLVLEREFYKPGKGGAFNRTKLKGLKSGKIVSQTFKTTESVEEIEVQTRSVVFSYNDENRAYFMDPVSFEMVDLPMDMVPNGTDFLLADAKYLLMTYEDEPLSIQVPAKISLKVVETAIGGDRGNTSGNPTKEAKVETGYTLQVPLFVNNGDKILINTESGEYVGKDNN